MRGALLEGRKYLVTQRIIPADAGSTRKTRTALSRTWDHPRGCGEHPRVPDNRGTIPGSSPRMRGALGCDFSQYIKYRIIPADAGSTYRRSAGLCAKEDHPRRCREHSRVRMAIRSCCGSSPQMRGARRKPPRELLQSRIIPADAGSTVDKRGPDLTPGDHPRGCGEHIDMCHVWGQV